MSSIQLPEYVKLTGVTFNVAKQEATLTFKLDTTGDVFALEPTFHELIAQEMPIALTLETIQQRLALE